MRVHPIEEPRIFGIETEYGINPDPEESFTQADIYDNSPEYLNLNPQGYCEYGRIYKDVWTTLEVCTPEVYTRDGLLASHFAGEELAREIVKGMFKSRASLTKHSLDSESQSRGDHENYRVGGGFSSNDQYKLVPFLVARAVLTGSGGVVHKRGDAYQYIVDPRLYVTSGREPIHNASTGSPKPLMKSLNAGNSIDPSNRTSRVQVVSGSMNMYPFPVAARMFTTSAVLRLIEHGSYPDELMFRDVPKAIHTVTRDVGTIAKIGMIDGKHYTAAQFMATLLEKAVELDLPADEKNMVKLSLEKLDALDSGNLDACRGYIEWVDKLQYIKAHAARYGYRPMTTRSAQLNLQWHERRTDHKQSIIEILRQKGRVALLPADTAIEAAKRMPPDKTRALKRAEYITAAAQRASGVTDIRWHQWQANDAKTPEAHFDAWGGYDPQKAAVSK